MTEHNDLDHDREERTNIPEVVFANGKDLPVLLDAVGSLLAGGRVLVTKCTPEQLDAVVKAHPGREMSVGEHAGIVAIWDKRPDANPGWSVAVISAGSSDMAVAEEVTVAAEFFGMDVIRFNDCGVAGLHRMQPAVDELNKGDIDCAVVIAGMEGTLPSVISGLVKQPIVAVPTSVGYGASFGGIAALLGMLNSCAAGVTVVNIDNGFGAAAAAHRILRRRAR